MKVKTVIEEVEQTIGILEKQLQIQSEEVGIDIAMQLESEKMKLEALEKQIAKKPRTYKAIKGVYGECPACGHTGLKELTHEHCWWCGQKIDWEQSRTEDLTDNKK